MSSFWLIFISLASIILGPLFSLAASMVYFRWKKRQEIPDELRKELQHMQMKITGLRVDVARIRGQLNFKEWKREA